MQQLTGKDRAEAVSQQLADELLDILPGFEQFQEKDDVVNIAGRTQLAFKKLAEGLAANNPSELKAPLNGIMSAISNAVTQYSFLGTERMDAAGKYIGLVCDALQKISESAADLAIADLFVEHLARHGHTSQNMVEYRDYLTKFYLEGARTNVRQKPEGTKINTANYGTPVDPNTVLQAQQAAAPQQVPLAAANQNADEARPTRTTDTQFLAKVAPQPNVGEAAAVPVEAPAAIVAAADEDATKVFVVPRRETELGLGDAAKAALRRHAADVTVQVPPHARVPDLASLGAGVDTEDEPTQVDQPAALPSFPLPPELIEAVPPSSTGGMFGAIDALVRSRRFMAPSEPPKAIEEPQPASEPAAKVPSLPPIPAAASQIPSVPPAPICSPLMPAAEPEEISAPVLSISIQPDQDSAVEAHTANEQLPTTDRSGGFVAVQVESKPALLAKTQYVHVPSSGRTAQPSRVASTMAAIAPKLVDQAPQPVPVQESAPAIAPTPSPEALPMTGSNGAPAPAENPASPDLEADFLKGVPLPSDHLASRRKTAEYLAEQKRAKETPASTSSSTRKGLFYALAGVLTLTGLGLIGYKVMSGKNNQPLDLSGSSSVSAAASAAPKTPTPAPVEKTAEKPAEVPSEKGIFKVDTNSEGFKHYLNVEIHQAMGLVAIIRDISGQTKLDYMQNPADREAAKLKKITTVSGNETENELRIAICEAFLKQALGQSIENGWVVNFFKSQQAALAVYKRTGSWDDKGRSVGAQKFFNAFQVPQKLVSDAEVIGVVPNTDPSANPAIGKMEKAVSSFTHTFKEVAVDMRAETDPAKMVQYDDFNEIKKEVCRRIKEKGNAMPKGDVRSGISYMHGQYCDGPNTPYNYLNQALHFTVQIKKQAPASPQQAKAQAPQSPNPGTILPNIIQPNLNQNYQAPVEAPAAPNPTVTPESPKPAKQGFFRSMFQKAKSIFGKSEPAVEQAPQIENQVPYSQERPAVNPVKAPEYQPPISYEEPVYTKKDIPMYTWKETLKNFFWS